MESVELAESLLFAFFHEHFRLKIPSLIFHAFSPFSDDGSDSLVTTVVSDIFVEVPSS